MKISTARLVRTALAVAALALGGCIDAPTMPDAVQQIAGGEAWVAIPEPRGLPELETWLPYLGDEAPATRAHVQALRRAAREATVDGRLEWAAELQREAESVTVLSLARSPDPQVIEAARTAIAEWSERVEDGIDPRVYPAVAASRARVDESAVFVDAALQAGDTTTAVLQLSAAARAIRSHGPASVALRVLALAESRLREREPSPVVLERAVHLIRSARHELVDGDPSRAVRRALYALQLAEGA